MDHHPLLHYIHHPLHWLIHVAIGLAIMDHHGKVQLGGEAEVLGKCAPLQLRRGVPAVVVEPGLADGNNLRGSRKIPDPCHIHLTLEIVRVGAYGGVHFRKGGGKIDDLLGGSEIRRRAEHPLQARSARPRHHLGHIGEGLPGEVRVRIHEGVCLVVSSFHD